MDVLQYCTTICGAKCCLLRLREEGPEPVRCPRLQDDNRCSIYDRRYGELAHERVVVVGYWKSRRYRNVEGEAAIRPFWCGHIKDIHASGGLPSEVAEQCAVLHPEILERYGKVPSPTTEREDEGV